MIEVFLDDPADGYVDRGGNVIDLYHYTCQHGRDAIGEAGELIPACRRGVRYPTGLYVWMTSLTVPIRDALGLTSDLTACDRTEYRYRVTDGRDCLPWTTVRRTFPDDWREALESGHTARPAMWWVSAEPVPVVLDQR